MGNSWRGNRPLSPLLDPELEIFLRHISSGSLTLSDVRLALSQPSGQLNVLKTLIRLYTSKVPWGSLANHYSNVSINSLEAGDVFDKLITRGRAGHCLEMVPLFASALRGLGYDFYFTAARISSAMAGDAKDGPGYHGWSHLVLIVIISGQKYIVDPQYIEITEPVLLDPQGEVVTFDGIPTTTIRLRYCPLSEIIPNRASNSGLRTWIFELKRSVKDAWTPEYMFSTETEWFLEDLPIMNVWLARAGESYLVTKFIIKRMVLADEGDMENENSTVPTSRTSDKNGLLTVPAISGSVELAHDTLTVFKYGEKVVNEKIETEQERLDMVKKWFGIALTEEEAKAVLSRPTSLRH